MTELIFNPPVIAHRGVSAYAPENTMAAFFKAAQWGVKWVEFDVMQAACGTPIIFHDESLDRTTNASGEVTQFAFTELQQLDAGSWFNPIYAGERILSLQQLLVFLCEKKMNANIEIKALSGQEEILVKKVLQQLNEFAGTLPTILFSSFSVAALHLLKKLAPQSMLGLLLHEWELDWEKTAEILDCVSIHVNEEILTTGDAQKIKKMNKKLLSYTVNDAQRARELFSWGVDAVFSDAPNIVMNNR